MRSIPVLGAAILALLFASSAGAGFLDAVNDIIEGPGCESILQASQCKYGYWDWICDWCPDDQGGQKRCNCRQVWVCP